MVSDTPTGSGKGDSGSGSVPDKVKIALSLYKVQQNIYLLDFQRVEVRHSFVRFVLPSSSSLLLVLFCFVLFCRL